MPFNGFIQFMNSATFKVVFLAIACTTACSSTTQPNNLADYLLSFDDMPGQVLSFQEYNARLEKSGRFELTDSEHLDDEDGNSVLAVWTSKVALEDGSDTGVDYVYSEINVISCTEDGDTMAAVAQDRLISLQNWREIFGEAKAQGFLDSDDELAGVDVNYMSEAFYQTGGNNVERSADSLPYLSKNTSGVRLSASLVDSEDVSIDYPDKALENYPDLVELRIMVAYGCAELNE